MMTFKQNLKLNCLVVFSSGKRVYEEQFHEGINIIRGDNSSGKSTISEFIFYSLGGENPRFNKDHLRCDWVFAEIKVNEHIITLKREVKNTPRVPISVFTGTFEESILNSTDKWLKFEYSRAESRKSFSEFLFDLLKLPKVVPGLESLVTSHQLLRILYGDQMTPTNAIFRSDTFDRFIIREAIGDIICGLYDIASYELKQTIERLEKEYEYFRNQYSEIVRFFKNTDRPLNKEAIFKKVSELRIERDRLSEELIKAKNLVIEGKSTKDSEQFEKTKKSQLLLKKELDDLSKEIQDTGFEITDSENFIKDLEYRLYNINESIEFQKLVPTEFFSNCPLCLTGFNELNKEKSCPITKDKFEISIENYLRVQLQISSQINESKKLLDELKNKKRSLDKNFREKFLQLESAEKQMGTLVKSISFGFDAILESSRRVGEINSQIHAEERYLGFTEALEELVEKKNSIKKDIELYKDKFKTYEENAETRKRDTYKLLSDNTIRFLSQDVAGQEEFKDGHKPIFDFSSDRIQMEGAPGLSASSTVILKNSFLLSLLISSLTDSDMNFPRFLLLDNIEDKGMVDARSQNFQRMIIKEFSKLNTPFQLIFSTSKIAPELNESDYTVGRFYTPKKKSLEF